MRGRIVQKIWAEIARWRIEDFGLKLQHARLALASTGTQKILARNLHCTIWKFCAEITIEIVCHRQSCRAGHRTLQAGIRCQIASSPHSFRDTSKRSLWPMDGNCQQVEWPMENDCTRARKKLFCASETKGTHGNVYEERLQYMHGGVQLIKKSAEIESGIWVANPNMEIRSGNWQAGTQNLGFFLRNEIDRTQMATTSNDQKIRWELTRWQSEHGTVT